MKRRIKAIPTSKACTKCKVVKELELYPKDKDCTDGHGSWCKSCCYKSGQIWCKKNKDRWNELHRKKQIKYRLKYPEKVTAHSKVSNAVSSGRLARLACEVCGNFLSEAHHPDYYKPLEVVWLCIKHHRLADKEKLTLYE